VILAPILQPLAENIGMNEIQFCVMMITILEDIKAGGDAKAMEYAAKFDNYTGNILLTEEEIAAASALVPEKLKADIQFAHDNVKRFAELQKSTVADVEMEIQPGYVAGQKAIPVDAAGCYVPGGRYSHIASAIMTVTTANSDEYAPEHLTVMADDLDWWLENLTCYGSLFLGEETTVSYGDKASGTNHVLPTSGAAGYTGGLSVHKYMKIVTWQRATRDASKDVAIATARISRLEGMEGHARAADVRLAKYFPEENFDLTPEG